MSKRVRLQKAIRAALVLGVLQSSAPVLALGLGDMDLRSFLNEPLRADVALLDLRGLTADDIRIRLAGIDDFDRLGVDRSYFLTAIKFEVLVDQRTGMGSIRLTTDQPVLEPYLDLIIEARWPSGRLLREYTVLVDPPAFRQEVLTVSASEEVRKTEEPPPLSPVREPSVSRGSEPVTVRGSDLPPGEMPERAFSAETALQPEAGSRYMVKRDETLWQIAASARPGGTSVQQAMLDIQRLNPEAFIDGNINRIKAGYIIYLPDAGDISSDDLASALEEVRDQNQAFNAGRRPGVTAAATLRVSADSGSSRGRDEASSGDALAGASTTGVRPGDSSEPDAGSGDMGGAADAMDGDASRDDMSGANAEELVSQAGGLASPELAAQLDAMTDRLDTLEQIVALKDEQIATLEQALREAREARAEAPETAAAPVVSPVAPPVPTPTASGSDGPSGFPLWPLIGGIFVLLAGMAFFVLRRRRTVAQGGGVAATDTDDVFAGVSLRREALDLADNDVEEVVSDREEVEADAFEAPASERDETDSKSPEDALSAVMGNRGYGERKHDDYIDEGAGGDALAEADIYIAYGRYLQAIELLNTAIEDEPGNSAYRLKLIELYVDMGEEGNAEQQVARLRESGDDEAIARAEALVGSGLRSLDYPSRKGGPSAIPETVDVDSDSMALDGIDVGDDAELEGTDEEDAADDPLADAEGFVIDPTEETVSDEELLELADSPAFREKVDSLEPMEFDALQIADDEPDEFEIDNVDELDIAGDIDELDLSEALDDAAPPEDGDASTEELVIADDADQMATKLDLARAYLDMGDGAGARNILEEVMGGGTGEQQQEARELLTRID